jgi:cell division protease FtsH
VVNHNEAIADRIDTEVCKIINHCEQIATEIILDNRVIIDLVVEKLLDAETIDGEEFRKISYKSIYNFTSKILNFLINKKKN